MKTQRTLNLAWPLVIAVMVLLAAGTAMGVGAYLFEDPATKKSYPNKTVAGFLGMQSGGVVELQTGAQPTEGQVLVAGCGTDTATSTATTSCAKFKAGGGGSGLPAGTPGQIPVVSAITATGTVTVTATQTSTGTTTVGTYSMTSTGTVTTTGTEIKMANGAVDFDPMGTFYFDTCKGECAIVQPLRINTLSHVPNIFGHALGADAATLTATCSTGNDALLTYPYHGDNWTIVPYDETGKTTGSLWPAGAWLARLRAKVNANGAAIRIHVYEVLGTYPHTETEWFNFTTDTFSNTDWATIEKLSLQAQRKPSSSSNWIGFRFYATCSTETTVSLEFGDAALTTRIESPIVVDRIYTSDVWGLDSAISTIEGDIADREPIISGTPGQFVKFIGTGTSATTSKGGVTVSIPTPVTTRSFMIPAETFTTGSGATLSDLGTYKAWNFRDGNDDYIRAAPLHIPLDYVSGLSAAVIWSPASTDSTSTHNVVWLISLRNLTTGSGTGEGSNKGVFGTDCGTNCIADKVITDSPYTLSGTFTAGASYMFKLTRYHSGGDDDYVGDARFIALRFSYTSTL